MRELVGATRGDEGEKGGISLGEKKSNSVTS